MTVEPGKIKRNSHCLTPRALLAPLAGAILVIAVGWPLLRLGLSLDRSALAVLAEASTWWTLAHTLIVALGTAVFATAVGVPLGLLVGRTDLPGARALAAALTVPYLVPPYVTAIAWIALAHPRIYGLGGLIWVMGIESAPLVMMLVADAARRADPALEEAARVAGAPPARVLRRISLRLIAPVAVEAAGLVVAHAAASFSVPYLLASGSSTPHHVLTTRIYEALALSPSSGQPIAVALAALVLLAGLVPVALVRLAARRWRVPTVGGKAAHLPLIRLGRLRWPLAVAVGAWAALAAGLPLATLVATSLLTSYGRGLSLDNLGVATWVAVLSRPATRGALVRSFELGCGAATAATVLGALVVLLRDRAKVPGGRLLVALARAPFTVPGTVLALGMLLAWSQEIRLIVANRVTFALALANTGWLLAMAYTVKYLAIPAANVAANLGAFDPSLEEAARISGASQLRAWRAVTLPLIRGSLVSSWLLVFVPAFTEVTLSVLLSGPDTRVVGVVLFDLQTYGDPPAAAVLAVVTAAVALAGNTLLRLAAKEG
jgi:iron(III) transport system permease protein